MAQVLKLLELGIGSVRTLPLRVPALAPALSPVGLVGLVRLVAAVAFSSASLTFVVGASPLRRVVLVVLEVGRLRQGVVDLHAPRTVWFPEALAPLRY